MNTGMAEMVKRGALALLLVLPALTPTVAEAASKACSGGAAFTTNASAMVVNGNIYADSTDVYLNGGPAVARSIHGPVRGNLPGGLPDGFYYFQVTNPSGKMLLSSDSISSRKFKVVNGYIQQVQGTHNAIPFGDPYPPSFTIVQLAPYLPTDNPGKEYKVWITPVSAYQQNKGVFGFDPSCSKTDNFKALANSGGGGGGGGPITFTVTLMGTAFQDLNLNGVWEPAGNPVEPGNGSVQIQVFQDGNPVAVGGTTSGTLGGWSVLLTATAPSLPVTFSVVPTLLTSTTSAQFAPTTAPSLQVLVPADGLTFGGLDFGVIAVGDSGSLIRLSPTYFAGERGQAVLAETYPAYNPAEPPALFTAGVLFQPACPQSSPFISLSAVGTFLIQNGASSDPICQIAANWLSLSLGIASAGGITGTETVYMGVNPLTAGPAYDTVNNVLAYVAANYMGLTPAQQTFYAGALHIAAENWSFIQTIAPPCPTYPDCF